MTAKENCEVGHFPEVKNILPRWSCITEILLKDVHRGSQQKQMEAAALLRNLAGVCDAGKGDHTMMNPTKQKIKDLTWVQSAPYLIRIIQGDDTIARKEALYEIERMSIGADATEDLARQRNEVWEMRCEMEDRFIDLKKETRPKPPQPLNDWTEEDGDVLWWRWNGGWWDKGAPYVGKPTDPTWEGRHTHWSPVPEMPAPA